VVVLGPPQAEKDAVTRLPIYNANFFKLSAKITSFLKVGCNGQESDMEYEAAEKEQGGTV
jgi:hypothetical protein